MLPIVRIEPDCILNVTYYIKGDNDELMKALKLDKTTRVLTIETSDISLVGYHNITLEGVIYTREDFSVNRTENKTLTIKILIFGFELRNRAPYFSTGVL